MATILDSTLIPGVRENRLKNINRQRNTYQWEKPHLDENDYLAFTQQTFEGLHGFGQVRVSWEFKFWFHHLQLV